MFIFRVGVKSPGLELSEPHFVFVRSGTGPDERVESCVDREAPRVD